MKSAVIFLLFVGASISFARMLPEPSRCFDKNEYLKANTVSSYSYEVETKTQAHKAASASAGINVRCKVDVETAPECVNTLKVLQCSIGERDPTKDGSSGEKPHPDSASFSNAMQKYPVSFELTNGSLLSLEAHQNEPLPILNFKRGIISILTTKKDVDQNEDDEGEMLRTDVQGTCPVKYSRVNPTTVRMTKDYKKCRFPSKIDWHYSPFSLVWNMSFIQQFLIKSDLECLHVMSSDGLKKAACTERHQIKAPFSPNNDNQIPIRTVVTQSLTLGRVVQQQNSPPKDLRANKGINYQYERSTVPTKPSQEIVPIATKLMNDLVSGTVGVVQAGIGHHFNDLVLAFREAAEFNNLKGIRSPCDNPSAPSACNPETKDVIAKLAAKYYTDAVVQCNSVPCIREVRRLANAGEISDRHLRYVLHSWSRIKITEPEVFTEFREICNQQKSRSCYLALSAAIHRFWANEKNQHRPGTDKIPSSVTESIKDVVALIGPDCGNDEKQSLIGLKAVGNMGSIARSQIKDVEGLVSRCVRSSSASWAVKVAAVQSVRRFKPTDELYTVLLDIVKDSSVELEARVWAHKQLVNGWQNAKMLKDVRDFIKEERKPTTDDFQLKKFINANLNSILVDRRNPGIIKFAKLIREELYDVLDTDKNDLRGNTHSSVTIEEAFHKISFLDDAVNQFGIRNVLDSLFDGKAYLPFAMFLNVSVQVFGRDVNLLEVLSSSRNEARMIAALAEHFSENGDEVEVDELYWAAYTNQHTARTLDVDPNAPLKFNYNVDESLLKNLERIRQASPIGFNPDKLASFLFSYRILGDELGFTNREYFGEALEKYKDGLGDRLNKPQSNSGATNIIEAYHFVPTLAGIPLTWSSVATVVRSLTYTLKTGHKTLEASIDFSGTIDVERSATISLPGYAHGTVNTFASASSSFDTSLVAEAQGSKLRLAIKVPKRQVNILSLSRKTTINSRKAEIELADASVEQATKSWCTDDIAKAVGVKVCHKSTHAKVQDGERSQWVLNSRPAQWQLTLDFTDKSVEKYIVDIDIQATHEAAKVSFDIGSDGAKLNKVVSANLDFKGPEEKYSGNFAIPALGIKIESNTSPNDQNGQNCVIDASIMGRKYNLQHTSSKSSVVALEQDLPNHVIKNKAEQRVDVDTSIIVLNAPNKLYTWNRTKTSYLHADVIDHLITFKPSQPDYHETSLLPPSFWVSDNEAQVQLHYHDNKNPGEPEFGEAFFKTAGFRVDLIGRAEDDDDDEFNYLNLTYRSLPDNKLESFINVSMSSVRDVSKQDSTESFKKSFDHRLSLVLPRVTWSVIVNGDVKKGHEPRGNVTFAIRRDKVTPADGEVEYWLPQNAGNFKTDSQELSLKLGYDSGATNEKEHQANFYAALSIPGYEPVKADAHIAGSRGPEVNVQGRYTISNPNINLLWKGTDKLAYTRPTHGPHGLKGAFNHRSVFSLIPPQPKDFAVYTLEGTLDGESIKARESFDSSFYVYNATLNWKYTAPQYSDLTLDILADSPTWEALKLQMKQVVYLNGRKMSLKNSLMDVDVDASWADGYHKKVSIKSKDTDLVPNLVATTDLKGREGNVLKFTLPDYKLDLYALPTISRDLREVTVTICKQRICEDIERDPDAFVSQYTFTLDDPTHVAVTVIRNPVQAKDLYKRIGRRAENWIQAIIQPVVEENHPLNKILEPLLGERSIAEWYSAQMVTIVVAAQSAATNAIEALASLQPFFTPIAEIGARAFYKLSALRADDDDDDDDDQYELDQHTSHFIPWLYYDEDDLTRAYARAIRNVDTEHLSIRPGPVPGKSHVRIYHLPIVMQRFTSFPKINYAYFEEKRGDDDDEDDDDDDDDHNSLLHRFASHFGDKDDDEEEATPDHPPYQFTFHDKRYNRYAVIWGVGNALSFDNQHYKLPTPKDGQCSHLLLHNRVNGKVTVARETNKLIFLFPSMKFELYPDGTVLVNDDKTPTDLPAYSNDDKVAVTRQGDIIEVSTHYHLNVKCSMSHYYCVFGTTDFTHNSLVGILGNNNGISESRNPTPSKDDGVFAGAIPAYRLSPEGTCKEISPDECTSTKEARSTDVCYGGVSRGRKNDYQLSKCHKLAEWDKFYGTCKHDQTCQGNGCSSINALRALCGAYDIPVDAPISCSKCVNGLSIDEEEKYTVQPEAEIIFLVDKSQKEGQDKTLERLNALSSAIDGAFAKNGFKKISYGLEVFQSHGDGSHQSKSDKNHPEQYSINGKILANLKEFQSHGLSRIDGVQKVTEAEEPCKDIILEALDVEERHYPLRPEAVRITVLITAQDVQEDFDMEDARNGIDELDPSYLFAISYYPEAEKARKANPAYSPIMTRDQANKQLLTKPNGLHARIAFATNGAVLHSDGDLSASIPKFVALMAERANGHVGQCRDCKCQYPTVYTPQIVCSHSYDCA